MNSSARHEKDGNPEEREKDGKPEEHEKSGKPEEKETSGLSAAGDFGLRFLKGSILPIAVILFWQFCSHMGWLNSYILPPPSQIAERLAIIAGNGELLRHVGISLYRVFYGFSLALIFALPLGFMVGLISGLRSYLSPSLSFFQQIPPIAWIPIFILWFGIGEASKIAIIVYSAFFPIFLNTLHGIANTDHKLKEVAYTYGLSYRSLITRVYLPSAAPSIFVGMRLGLSFCWRALVAAELLGASMGIGYLIQEGRAMAQSDLMLASVLVIGLIGLCFDFIFLKLEKHCLPWRERADKREVSTWSPS